MATINHPKTANELAADPPLLDRLADAEPEAMKACDAVIAFMEHRGIKELTIRVGETTRKGRGTRATWTTPISIEFRGVPATASIGLHKAAIARAFEK